MVLQCLIIRCEITTYLMNFVEWFIISFFVRLTSTLDLTVLASRELLLCIALISLHEDQIFIISRLFVASSVSWSKKLQQLRLFMWLIVSVPKFVLK